MPIQKKWSKFTRANILKLPNNRGVYELANKDKRIIDTGGSDDSSAGVPRNGCALITLTSIVFINSPLVLFVPHWYSFLATFAILILPVQEAIQGSLGDDDPPTKSKAGYLPHPDRFITAIPGDRKQLCHRCYI